MGIRINTNIAALRAQNTLTKNKAEQSKSLSRLSSGNRITNAGEDSAGLAIAENLKSQIRSNRQAERNAMDGVSFVQVAEGALNETAALLIRMRELSIQAASDTISDRERQFVDRETQSLKAEITRIASTTEFNGINLLSGEGKSQLEFHVGRNNGEHDRIVFDTNKFTATADALGVDGVSTSTTGKARDSLDAIDNGLAKISGQRAELGGYQNRLQVAASTLSVSSENLSNARSRIADTDVAEEVTKLTQSNILEAATISVMAQANSSPHAALKLL